MSERQETVDDIIAEARDEYTVHNCNQCNYRKSCDLNTNGFDSDECRGRRQSIMLGFGIEDGYFTKILDRLDAAHKREMSKSASKNGADFGQLGDAAKLREALKDIGRIVEQIRLLYSDFPSEIHAIARKANAALAAPPRNCDRFKDASDAWDAYDAFVDSYRAQGKTEPLNEFGWLYAPATEKEGGVK